VSELRPFLGEREWLEKIERDRGRRRNDRARHQSQRVWAAIMVSPTVEIAEALLRGFDVPASRLDQKWARRLGWV
jgi:hypothetical protein